MRYLTRRVVHAALLLTAISVFSFALLQWAPGNFFDAMRLNPRISAQTVNGLRSEHGMNRSFPLRYAHWAYSVLKGDMGFSFSYNTPVAPLLWTRARNTLFLTGIATLLAWLLAIPVGIWSAANKGTWGDRACAFSTSALLTIPDLLLFLILLLLAVRTGWFPVGGMVSTGFP